MEKIGMKVSFEGTIAIISVVLVDINGDKKVPLPGRKISFFVNSSERETKKTSESQDDMGYVEFRYTVEPEKLYAFSVKAVDSISTEEKKKIGIRKNGELFFEEPPKRKPKERKGVGFGSSLRSKKLSSLQSEVIISLAEIGAPKEEGGSLKFPVSFEIKNFKEFVEEVEEDLKEGEEEVEFELIVTDKKNRKKKFKFFDLDGSVINKKIFKINLYEYNANSVYEEVGIIDPVGEMLFSIVYMGENEKGRTIPFATSNVREAKVEGFTAKSISRVMVTKSGIGTSHRISILCMNDKNIPTDAEIVIIDKGMKVMKTKKGVLNYDVNLNNDEEERIIKISVPSCINFLQREHKIRIRNLN